MGTAVAPVHAGQVVVGIDGSEHAAAAAEWAASEAARRGVAVRLVHASFPPDAWSAAAASALLVLARGELRAAANAVRAAQPRVPVRTVLRHGHPTAVLREESVLARAVVLGARGRHGFDGLMLGSVAAGVAAHAHCPVAVIHAAPARPDGPVVLGVGEAVVGDAALEMAFDEASARMVSLVVVHEYPQLADPTGSREVAERLARWCDKYPDVPVERVELRHSPTDALLERVATAQLVVVDDRGAGGPQQLATSCRSCRLR